MVDPNHPSVFFSMDCDQWWFLHVKSIYISPSVGYIKLLMPTLDCKAITSPLWKLENQHYEVAGEVQARTLEFCHPRTQAQEGCKKEPHFARWYEEEPKPSKEVSIEVKKEELAWKSSKGKSEKSHERDDHIAESSLKEKKKLPKHLLFKDCLYLPKPRLPKAHVREIKGMYLS